MATFSGAFSGRPADLRMNVWVNSQNVSGNYSNLGWNLVIVKTGNTTAFASDPSPWNISIAGAVANGTFTYNLNGPIGQTIQIGGIGSLNVPHYSDGTMDWYSAAAATDNYGFLGSASLGGWTSAPTIPRATWATWESFTTNAVPGVSKRLLLPRASSSFTHTVDVYFGDYYKRLGTGLATYIDWTPEMVILNQIPNAVVGTGYFRTYTYNGSTLIGTRDSVFDLEAGPTVLPTFTTTVHSESVPGVATNVGRYVQGVSKLSLSVTGKAGAYGSTITDVKTVVAGQTVSGDATTPAPIADSGTVPIVTTVTDSRGRSAQKTVNATVLAYSPPAITAITVERALSGGTPNEEGTYLRVNVQGAVKSLVNTTERNALVYRVRTRLRGTPTWALVATITPTTTPASGWLTYSGYTTVAGYATADAYDVRVELADDFTYTPFETVLATSRIFMHWDGSEGIGIGKYRTQGTLDMLGQGYQNDGAAMLDVLSVASETVKGPVEIATTAEVAGLLDPDRVVVPAKLRAGVKAVGGLVPRIPTGVGVAGGGTATIGPTGRVSFSGTNGGIRLDGVFDNTARQYVIRLSVTAQAPASDWWYAKFTTAGVHSSTNAWYVQSEIGQYAGITVLDNAVGVPYMRIGWASTNTTASTFFRVELDGPNSNLRGVGGMFESMYSEGGAVTWVSGAGMWNGAGNFDGIVIYPGGSNYSAGQVQVFAYE